MKTNFFYVQSINLYVNVAMIQSFQLVEKTIFDYDSGKYIDVNQCCISMGKNAFFCDEKYYYELYKLLANGN